MAIRNQNLYFGKLKNNRLNDEKIKILKELIETRIGKKLEKVPDQLLKRNPVITDKLAKLPLYIYRGNKSWGGLFVCFPGTKEDLGTKNVSTPYLRHILYPVIELQQRLRNYYNEPMPCIYLIGERFNDVFLRKFRLLKLAIPHVIILTGDIYECYKNRTTVPGSKKMNNENWIKYLLCKMSQEGNLIIPSEINKIDFRYICNELPTYEGTQNPERLDILGYDIKDKALVAFEIKRPNTKDRIDLENLFLQGLEHLHWLEENKMAIKLLFEGPRGKNINTRKRVKLVLGFGGQNPPELFEQLRRVKQKDKYLNLVFCKLDISQNYEALSVGRFGDKIIKN